MKKLLGVLLIIMTFFCFTACKNGNIGENSGETGDNGNVGNKDGTIISDVANFDLANAENGSAPTVRLNSGYEMPKLGLGTYSLHGDTCKNSVNPLFRRATV